MRVIDAWIQHPSPAFLREPMFESLLRWLRIKEIPNEIPLEFTSSAMEAARLSHAILTAWWGPSGALISNDEVAAAVSKRPDLFSGIASVDISQPMKGVRELRRAVKALGLRGLRILPWLWGLPPNDRRYYPLYAECIELGIPFCLQVGHTGPLRTSETGRPIPYLEDVALEFPELTIIAGHVGAPWTEEMLSIATKFERVYIDTSAYKPKRYPEALVKFIKGRGKKKVLFASNWPMVQPAVCLAQLDELALDDETARLFLAENAHRAFNLPA